MAGKRKGGETDYLVEAKPERDPDSFEQALREALMLERDCVLGVDIAEELGVSPGRVSQVLKEPEKLDTKSIDRIMSRIEGPENRRRVLRAWVRARYGTDPGAREGGGATGSRPTEKTLRRIDRQIRESRLRAAARTAGEAAAKADDAVLREQLLDRAYFARQRLDEPGQAMAVARVIAAGARNRGEPRRLAAAHLFRARVLMGLADARPGEVFEALGQADALLAGQSPAPDPAPPYALATEGQAEVLRLSARIGFLERGLLKAEEPFLREALASLRARATRGPYQRRFHALQTAARVHLLLGETAAAQEALEKAFASGETRNLNAYEMSGLIQGRVLRETEGPEAALRYLREVRSICLSNSDRYHARLAEYDLARLESRLFQGPRGAP